MCGLYFFCEIRRTTTNDFVAWVVNKLMRRLKQQILTDERLKGQRNLEARRFFNVKLNSIRGGMKRGREDDGEDGEGDGERDSKRKKMKVEHTFRTLEGHLRVNSVSFSPDGKHIASGSNENTVKVWSLESGEWVLRRTLEGHSSRVTSVSFSPDGQLIASGSDDSTMKVWSVSGVLQKTLEGHSGGVYSVSFSPDSKHVASGSRDHTVKVWDVESGELRRTLEGHSEWVYSVSFSPDGKHVASGSYDNTVKVWSLQSGVQKTLEGHSDWVNSVSFSPDGQRIASSSDDKTVKVWSLESGGYWALEKTLEGHSDWVNSVSFAPDGQFIASGSRDNTVKVWSVASGECVTTLEGHSDGVTSVSFSPNGQFIASGSLDKTVKVWSVPVLQFQPQSKKMYGMFPEIQQYEIKYGMEVDRGFRVSNFGDLSSQYDKTTDMYTVQFFINASLHLKDMEEDMKKMKLPVYISLRMDRHGIIQSVSTDIPEEFSQLKTKIEVPMTVPDYIDMLEKENILLQMK